jgi:hypothetical protein
MSATTGTGERRTISPSASAERSSGTATRTTSQPASARRPIWASVASMSQVIVVVMDCTTTGAPPPMRTPPTSTGRVRSRGGCAGDSGGAAATSGEPPGRRDADGIAHAGASPVTSGPSDGLRLSGKRILLCGARMCGGRVGHEGVGAAPVDATRAISHRIGR